MITTHFKLLVGNLHPGIPCFLLCGIADNNYLIFNFFLDYTSLEISDNFQPKPTCDEVATIPGFCVQMFEFGMLALGGSSHVGIVHAASNKTFFPLCCCSPSPQKAQVWPLGSLPSWQLRLSHPQWWWQSEEA